MVPCLNSLEAVFLPELAKLRHGTCWRLHGYRNGPDTWIPLQWDR